MSQVWVTFTFALTEISVDFHLRCFSGPTEVPLAVLAEGDVSTEAEAKRQRRSRSARITRRSVPLARDASAELTFHQSKLQSKFTEQASDDGL